MCNYIGVPLTRVRARRRRVSRAAGEEEKKGPSGLDGCDTRCLSSILLLVLSFLLFSAGRDFKEAGGVGSSASELLFSPTAISCRLVGKAIASTLQITFQGTSRLELPLHRCCPPAATNFPLLCSKRQKILLSSRFNPSRFFFFYFSLTCFFIFMFFTHLVNHCTVAARLQQFLLHRFYFLPSIHLSSR